MKFKNNRDLRVPFSYSDCFIKLSVPVTISQRALTKTFDDFYMKTTQLLGVQEVIICARCVRQVFTSVKIILTGHRCTCKQKNGQ